MGLGAGLGLLLILIISAACHYVFWKVFRFEKRIGNAVEDRIFRRKSKDTDVDQTMAARADIGNLPGHMDYIAGFGKEQTAPETLNDTILRPTLGLRLISGVLGLALLWMIWLGPAEYTGGSLWIKLGLTAGLMYVTAHTNFYELRYDRNQLDCPNFFFQRRTYQWHDLQSIRDNGHYAYALRMQNGKKVEVQKYLVGISAFVAYAKDRIVQNNLM